MQTDNKKYFTAYYTNLMSFKREKNPWFIQIDGFEGPVTNTIMHPNMPRIFACGTENAIYAFSCNNEFEKNDEIYKNFLSIDVMNTNIEERAKNFQYK